MKKSLLEFCFFLNKTSRLCKKKIITLLNNRSSYNEEFSVLSVFCFHLRRVNSALNKENNKCSYDGLYSSIVLDANFAPMNRFNCNSVSHF